MGNIDLEGQKGKYGSNWDLVESEGQRCGLNDGIYEERPFSLIEDLEMEAFDFDTIWRKRM